LFLFFLSSSLFLSLLFLSFVFFSFFYNPVPLSTMGRG